MTDLLDLAIEAHGGLARWREVKRLQMDMSISGALLSRKGLPQGLPNISVTVEPAEQRVSIRPFSGPGRVGHYSPDRLWITDAEGQVAAERTAPRAAFGDHDVATLWDELHVLYFFGYANANYAATPFMFRDTGFEVAELDPHQECDETWRRLRVRFPRNVPTHCDEQVYYFSEDGLVRRFDYAPDVAIGIPVAHYCFDHTSVDGIVMPMLRRVVRRAPTGRPAVTGPTTVLLHVTRAVIE